MKLERFAPIVIAVLGLLATAAPAAQSLTADQIIEKHLAASGGREALSKLTSRRATGTVTIGTPGGDLTGPIEISTKAPNKLRVAIQLDLTPMGVNDKMVIEQKFDGTAGWMINSMQGDTQITGNQLDNMRNNTFPTPLLDYKTAGAKVELQPQETIEGKPRLVLLVTPKSGSAIRLYFDPETYLLVRTKATVNTPEMGEVEQIGDVSDYRTVDGFKIPFHVVNWNSQQSVTIKLEKIENNVTIDDAIFSAKGLAAAR